MVEARGAVSRGSGPAQGPGESCLLPRNLDTERVDSRGGRRRGGSGLCVYAVSLVMSDSVQSYGL